jgi:hypothetical protein
VQDLSFIIGRRSSVKTRELSENLHEFPEGKSYITSLFLSIPQTMGPGFSGSGIVIIGNATGGEIIGLLLEPIERMVFPTGTSS